VVPEVVRLELEELLTKFLSEIRDAHNELLTVFGSLKEVVLPTDSEIGSLVAGIVPNLDVPTREIPLTLEAAKSSLLKVVRKVPPSSEKNQQFKDGAIWAACVALLAEDDVYLVTEDSAFYEERQYAKGPARNLVEEADGHAHQLHLLSSLSELLKSIRVDVRIDESGLVAAFVAANIEGINGLLSRTGFVLGSNPTVSIELFATEASSRLYAEFEIHYSCPDGTQEDRADAELHLAGSGFLDTSTMEFLELRNRGETLIYVNADGEQKVQNHVFGMGSLVIGHRTVERTVKFPLNEATGVPDGSC